MVMTRPRKKEINLSKDSILSLLQEIYNELVEQEQPPSESKIKC